VIWLSEILMQEHELESFVDLEAALKQRAIDGERFFGIDVKPPFSDTPANWEAALESIFVARY
jgi:hypothetical protein